MVTRNDINWAIKQGALEAAAQREASVAPPVKPHAAAAPVEKETP